ncbi:MAG: ACP phosphodiesterase [Bacteroidota bacterium]
MNYLGHAFLSNNDGEILTGNMIGDHVKGLKALEAYPPRVKAGLMLHRKIDSFADVHPATQRAKLLFRQDYGLYSGAIMDTVNDHFLANDPKYFLNDAALFSFTQSVYLQLEKNAEWFPSRFAEYFQHMRTHNWLYHYRTLKGLERSLSGLHRRALHMPPIDKAYEIFVSNYYYLNQCYFDLIGDVVDFVKIEWGNDYTKQKY